MRRSIARGYEDARVLGDGDGAERVAVVEVEEDEGGEEGAWAAEWLGEVGGWR